jgi:ABC-type polar amino acid transport system ATPase subunit
MHYQNNTFKPDSITKKQILSLRRSMGMVFQSFGLFSHLTVLDNLTIILHKIKHIKGDAAETLAKKTLTLVGLQDKFHAFPHQLSGGQQQRVGIARSLVASPELLLFDEPTSALDPELVGEVLRVIKYLAKQGNTMILVTHEMSFAKEVADRILFMDHGQLIADKSPKEIFSKDAHPRVQQFLNNYVI